MTTDIDQLIVDTLANLDDLSGASAEALPSIKEKHLKLGRLIAFLEGGTPANGAAPAKRRGRPPGSKNAKKSGAEAK